MIENAFLQEMSLKALQFSAYDSETITRSQGEKANRGMCHKD